MCHQQRIGTETETLKKRPVDQDQPPVLQVLGYFVRVLSQPGHLQEDGLSWSHWTCSCHVERLQEHLQERLEAQLLHLDPPTRCRLRAVFLTPTLADRPWFAVLTRCLLWPITITVAGQCEAPPLTPQSPELANP